MKTKVLEHFGGLNSKGFYHFDCSDTPIQISIWGIVACFTGTCTSGWAQGKVLLS